MTGLPPSSSRRYNEKEVALVFKHASELQQSDAPGDPAAGMSLVELEQIAREAGLDPALVRRAAADLDTRVSDQTPSRLLGAPTSLRLERTIEGEVPAEEYEMLVLEIQRELGGMGTASTLGKSFQWTSAPSGRRRSNMNIVQITVTPRNGRTTIRIEQPLSSMATGVFAGLMGGFGMGMMPLVGVAGGAMGAAGGGLGFQVAGAVGLCAAFFGGTYAVARALFIRLAARRGDKLQTLMSRLAEHVAATAVKPPTG